MAQGQFQTPITIKEAIDKIQENKYLLPAIQRKFVWSSYQIETLFDSIMRDYPINSFMFWEITEEKIKNEFKFYQFIHEYRQWYKEENQDIDTKGSADFIAVIDGQQRLTSIFIGLKGSYAYKMPRKWWKDDEENIPTRHLFLNLARYLGDDNERSMKYDFRFLTKKEFENSHGDDIWFKVNDILKFGEENKLDEYIENQEWKNNKDAKDIIRTLRRKIFNEQLINYYLERSQEIDKVLDIFIRTNSGGEPLTFSNLLMSITTANWEKLDARKSMADVIKEVANYGRPEFRISADLVLKTCLVLFAKQKSDIRFSVANFDENRVKLFEKYWDDVKMAIVSAFKLLEKWGLNDTILRAKNAVIPIVYYIYIHRLQNSVDNRAWINNNRESVNNMRKWLYLSILRGIFGGQPDSVLSEIKTVLDENYDSSVFPFDKIEEKFLGKNKTLSLTDEYVDNLLLTQMESPMSYIILSLIYNHLDFDQQTFHKDHLHPKSYFEKLINEHEGMSDDDYKFYTDPLNYNSILNLQLLDASLNEQKKDIPLDKWVADNNIDKDKQLIPNDVSLSITGFEKFIKERKSLLKKKLFENIGYKISGHLSVG